MLKLNLKVNLKTQKNIMENITIQMEQFMKDNFMIIKFMEMEKPFGVMVECT